MISYYGSLVFSASRAKGLRPVLSPLIRNYSTLSNRYNTWAKLPVVKTLVESAIEKAHQNKKPLPFKNTAIWYVQHSFETSLSVLDAFVALGADPTHIGVIDKEYSRCRGIGKEIMNRNINYKAGSPPGMLGGFKYSFMRDVGQAMSVFMKNLSEVNRIIVVSHGQNFLELIPSEIIQKYPIVGVEKTTSGLMDANIAGLPFPVINMAGCAAKLVLESPIIADELIKKVTPFIPIANQTITCGVVGYGSIGKALTHKLLSMGHNVIVYDQDPSKLRNISAKSTTELVVLLGLADYIFGCTGRDITQSLDIFNFWNRDKTLISCSSGDNEFLSLLQLIQRTNNQKTKKNALDDIEYLNSGGANIRILRGGFPINFDGMSEGSSPEKIQLTRALSVAAALHAHELFESPEIICKGGIIKLSPSIQKLVSQEFLRYQPKGLYSKETVNNFKDENWISENSHGSEEVTAMAVSRFKK
ncbi:MAG TPA: NAD(P)-dependent oxidoreductase [Gammaproteobacteria bacterium]|nr:NAD(P)-dependent oxidoreductase [Gammaproteobacteria bacterium]